VDQVGRYLPWLELPSERITESEIAFEAQVAVARPEIEIYSGQPFQAKLRFED